MQPGDIDAHLLRTDELALASACARGVASALAVFEAQYLPAVDGPLRRLGLDAAAIDELKQELRVELFVGAPDRAPAVTNFAGRGQLRGWLRVVAVRAARRRFVGQPRSWDYAEEDEASTWLAAVAGDAEISAMKQAYRDQFRRAFGAALRSLDDRARTLLELHLGDGLDHGEIGLLYRVHRTTVLRWFVRILDRLRDETRSAMRAELAIDSGELESILRLIGSRLEVSLSSQLELARG